MGFRWLLGFSQVARGLGDHFATTVAHLWASCVLSVAFSVPFLPFRFPNRYLPLAEGVLEYEHCCKQEE